jgi:hypothetical protein
MASQRFKLQPIKEMKRLSDFYYDTVPTFMLVQR